MAKRKTNTDTPPPAASVAGRGASTADRDGTITADALASALATKADGPALELVLTPVSAFQLAALVHVGTRHPCASAAHQATAARFIQAVRAYFADVPTVVAALDQCEDPTRDRLDT
jgi:hypothetical protein